MKMCISCACFAAAVSARDILYTVYYNKTSFNCGTRTTGVDEFSKRKLSTLMYHLSLYFCLSNQIKCSLDNSGGNSNNLIFFGRKW
ncbi:hypothetical protein PF005_g20102 [Phytophthora fragariae]|uniref:Secreted protein n=1 Tax=Phytophthora fragariae TaxID=53985 RepID=A0A6A3E6I1_9STRA|nr:hypothetical protein PF003_g37129 [Phytophthora fragariae]KAE8928043.1 hypothetical protein PF009_g21802 [Phytophthora fragariae]KAE8988850.1 hypothetical protein PF011_g19014 [Phytophthora fragariae]KAE9086230.1 hypothetical protein PF007_g20857 [Phytophthora fragariae]KAE9115960.1 hypothetical protein PF006_g19155 [Phytophthora fragariae]